MGFSVELFETIGWAEAVLPAAERADVRRLPGCTPRRGTPASSDGPRSRPRTPTGPPSSRARPGYESCEPGYATFIEALGQVYCGNLDRYVELTRERRCAAAARAGLRDRRVRRRTAVRRTGRGGAASSPSRRSRRRASSATRTGSPTRCGSSGWPTRRRTRSAPCGPGTRPSRTLGEHDVRFFEGFLARDAALLHTSDGQLETALSLFGTSIGAFVRSGAVAQLVITLASLPALFERLDRPGVAPHAARRDGPRGGQLPPRARRSPISVERLDDQLGQEASERFAAAGARDGRPRRRGVRPPPDRPRSAGADDRRARAAAVPPA